MLYGKLKLVEKCIKEVIEEKIEQGLFDSNFKNEILNALFWENPANIYNIRREEQKWLK